MSIKKASRREAVRLAASGAPSRKHHPANRRLFSLVHSTVRSLRFLALQEASNSSLRSSTVLGARAIGRRAGRAISSSSGLGARRRKATWEVPFVVFALVYLLLRRLVRLTAISSNEQLDTEVELVVLRHQPRSRRSPSRRSPRRSSCVDRSRCRLAGCFRPRLAPNAGEVDLARRLQGVLEFDPGYDGSPIASSTSEQACSQRLHTSPQIRQCSWWSAWRSHSLAQIAQSSLHEATCALTVAAT